MEEFLEQDHPLSDYRDKIEHFRGVAQELAGLDDLVVFDMFHLECHDVKRGLGSRAQQLVGRLVEHLAALHIRENERWVFLILALPGRGGGAWM